MKKILTLCSILILSVSSYTQTEDSTANVLKSAIIDHSDVQSYIRAHPLVEKKRAFFQGYRIQIYSGNNKEDANKVKSDFYSKFPAMRCYLNYQQPYYKLRVGDYDDQESAKLDTRKLAKHYPSSFLVPDEVRRIGLDTEKDKKP